MQICKDERENMSQRKNQPFPFFFDFLLLSQYLVFHHVCLPTHVCIYTITAFSGGFGLSFMEGLDVVGWKRLDVKYQRYTFSKGSVYYS